MHKSEFTCTGCYTVVEVSGVTGARAACERSLTARGASQTTR